MCFLLFQGSRAGGSGSEYRCGVALKGFTDVLSTGLRLESARCDEMDAERIESRALSERYAKDA